MLMFQVPESHNEAEVEEIDSQIQVASIVEMNPSEAIAG